MQWFAKQKGREIKRKPLSQVHLKIAINIVNMSIFDKNSCRTFVCLSNSYMHTVQQKDLRHFLSSGLTFQCEI